MSTTTKAVTGEQVRKNIAAANERDNARLAKAQRDKVERRDAVTGERTLARDDIQDDCVYWINRAKQAEAQRDELLALVKKYNEAMPTPESRVAIAKAERSK